MNQPYNSTCTSIALPALLFGLLWSSGASAASDWVDRLTVSGFMSTHYSFTDEAVPFDGERLESGIDEDGSFQGSKIGVLINARVNEQVDVAT